MRISTAKRKHGLSAKEVVAFIRNRHCSRVAFTDTLDRALYTAAWCHVEEETIAADIEAVAAYNDLDQYCRP